MRRALRAAVTLAVACSVAAHARELSHRVWLLPEVPDAPVLAALRDAGVDQLVVPLGTAVISGSTTTFDLHGPNGADLSGWALAALVWVTGSGEDAGDAAHFLSELAPALRTLRGQPRLVLASQRPWPGLGRFAAAVAKHAGRPVEVAAAAQDLERLVPAGGWTGVEITAVVFGNADALGFPPSTLHDDLGALERLGEKRVSHRGAIVVLPQATPPPGAAGVSLAVLGSDQVASYRPSERGDVFTLLREVDWGGVRVPAGGRIETDAPDLARYHRDLGLLLRGFRPGLVGWDTVGVPRAEPTIGISLEAFLAYFDGASPYPQLAVRVEPLGLGMFRVTVENPSATASALATAGNYVELRFDGASLRDLQLGGFTGVRYGRPEGGGWRETTAREASAVRLFMRYVAPRSVTQGVVAFSARPRALSVRSSVRAGDGTEQGTPPQRVLLTSP